MPFFDDIAKSLSEQGYVAPTFYKPRGFSFTSWAYYSSFAKAAEMADYFAGKTSNKPTADGYLSFANTGANETAGINVDFFFQYKGKYYGVPYSSVRKVSPLPLMVVRFYKPTGAGPYYTVISGKQFGIAATVVNQVSPEKLRALDDFHRQLALLKYKYNGIIALSNELQKLPADNPLRLYIPQLTSLRNQLDALISTIKGVDIYYNADGTIGVLWFLIAAIVIVAGATAWTVTRIIEEKEKTQRIVESFDAARWVDDKIISVQQNTGLSGSQKASIISQLTKTKNIALGVAAKSAKESKGLFSNVADIVKWGAIGLIALKGFQLIENKRQP